MVSASDKKSTIYEEYNRLVRRAGTEKITLPPQVSGLTSRNTKEVLLDAVRQIEERIAENATESISAPAAPVSVKLRVETQKSAATPTTETAPAERKGAESEEEDDDLNYLNQEIKTEIKALTEAKAFRKKEYADILTAEQELIRFVEMINASKSDNWTQKEQQEAKKQAQEERERQTFETRKEELHEKKEKELSREYDYKTTMAKKDADATIQALERKLENLKADCETALKEREEAQARLKQANEDGDQLYLRTVESISARGMTFLGSVGTDKI